MTLYFIGLGLGDEKDITVRGLEAVKKCDVLYLDNYTSQLSCSIEALKKCCGKEIILANRDLVETKAEQTILKDAKTKNVAFLVVGDPLVATTHTDLLLRAKKAGIQTEIIHNTAINSAIAETGLHIYKFGAVASVPFTDEKFFPETPYTIIKENLARGLHTLVLLDLIPAEKKFMTIEQGLKFLLEIEKKKGEKIILPETKALGCARIGTKNSKIQFGTIKDIMKQDFGEQLHCIIIPGKMHFMEEEFLQQFII